VSTLQSDITDQETARQEAWSALVPIKSRLIVLKELLDRFGLLANHYSSDIARLDAMIEAADVFSRLPSTPCPLCGAVAHEVSEADREHNESAVCGFQEACRREIEKIRSLMADLKATAQRLTEEQTALLSERLRRGLSYSQATARLEHTLEPQIQQGQSELMDLIAKRNAVAGASSLVNEIAELRQKRQALEASMKKKKRPKTEVTSDATTRNAEHFCRVVEELLKSWNYPSLDRVVFDAKKCDLVISDRDRGSQGKGYRALAHAAFKIGLMRYCREVNLPHPGLVLKQANAER
jgi:DNA repair exonuclease SbcCD ATPase subunit